MEPLKIRIGRQINQQRVAKGLTQIQLAEAVQTAQYIISKIEKGKYNLHIDMLERIGKALGQDMWLTFDPADA